LLKDKDEKEEMTKNMKRIEQEKSQIDQKIRDSKREEALEKQIKFTKIIKKLD